jgi:hypothetical protein
MTGTVKYKRRTYKDVDAEGYARGWAEGRELARKEFEEAWRLLSKHDSETMAELLRTQSALANVSLRRLAWQRVKQIFSRNKDHDFQ